ncbi:type IV pilus modification protein PilV [Marinobacter sp.]|uniref:type IV pilus modification protein PilV n=1 Tax=Marinobacter sp. TaxID=50741 RepID=UPI00384B00CC
MKMIKIFENTKTCRGFTLIEILVTMVILAVGLLGLAGLVMDGMRNNQGAYLRTQASILAYDMADRMRANHSRATGGGDYAGFSTVGASTAIPACTTDAAGCTPAEQAIADKAQWTSQLQGVGAGMAVLPGGVGEIAYDAGSNTFTVSVSWQEIEREGDAGEAIADDNKYEMRVSL